MPAYQLVIAPAAKKDLETIYEQGVQLWGQAQSSSYLDSLKETLWTLTQHPLIGVERPEFFA